MKKDTLCFLIVIFMMGIYHSQSAWAGQVISKADRDWAKTVLAQEQSLASEIGADTVAVLYFQNMTPNREIDPFQKGIAIMLITDLSKVNQLTIVERTRIQALMDELALSRSGITAPGASPETGKLLGANFIVGGNFLAGEKSPFKIASDILNVKVPERVDGVFSEGQYQELLTIEKDLAFKIIKALKIKLSEKQQANVAKPMSTHMKALGYFFTGIDLSDRGKYQSAKKYYQKAIALDPELSIAIDAVSELATLKLVPQPTASDKIMSSARKRTSTTNTSGFDQRISKTVTGAGQEDALTDIRVKW